MELTKNCTGCMACYNKCPNNAIEIVYSEDGFYTPKINTQKCTNCGACNLVCPQNETQNQPQAQNQTPNQTQPLNQAQSQAQAQEPTVGYAVMASDEIRKNSASGGLFALLAGQYLKEGGYVCGAAFSEDFRHINHIIISDEKDLIRLQNSKYVQSNIGSVLAEIKSLLDSGKKVLFSGTPCQVAGLKSFLGKNYDNLFTVDLICHGIPSPLVWEKYLDALSKGKKVQNILFRNKNNGWRCQMELLVKLKGMLFSKWIKDSWFFRGFFDHLFFNNACYSCKYTNLQRPADISIGDFWGIGYKDRSMDDKKGTSLLVINTPKGQKVIDTYKSLFKRFKAFSIDDILESAERLRVPVQRNLDNTQFVKDLERVPILENIKRNLCPKYDGVIRNLWYCSNFGATLSAYAIQQYFQERGKDYYLLKTSYPKDFTAPFAEKYLKTTHRVSFKEHYQELNRSTDNFVIGTDQVLRPVCLDEYSLGKGLFGFTSFGKKRVSFSGSFGQMHLEEMRRENRLRYGKLIKRFDYISTREVTGVDICKKEFNIDAECVIDPVMLIDKSKWLEMAPDTKDKYKDKIVCYMLRVDDELDRIREYLSKKYNREVIMLVNKELAIDEFLSAIRDSYGVVTNSFHGTCFSLIFNKKVLAITDFLSGDARFDTLIKKFHIENITANSVDEIYERSELFNDYDFNIFHGVVEKEREKAEIWFEKALNSKKRITLKNIFAELDYRVFQIWEKSLRFVVNKYLNLKFLILCHLSGKKIVLWGASLYLADLFKKYPMIPKNILGIIDTNPERHYKELCGCTIYPPEKLAGLNPKLVVSTVKNKHQWVYREIRDYIRQNAPHIKLYPEIFDKEQLF